MENDMDKYQLDTLAVRAGIERSQFGENSEALYLTSSFVFKSAAQAAERFAERGVGIERLHVLEAQRDRAPILGVLKLADLYLDSFPYSGAVQSGDCATPSHCGIPSFA